MISALLFAASAASFTAPSFTQANAAELEEAYGGGETGAVLIDATGKPQACYADKDAPQAYADVACTQVSGVTFGTLKDDAGKPVSYVRSMIVDFELASASPAAGG
jgi:hypothetical protein